MCQDAAAEAGVWVEVGAGLHLTYLSRQWAHTGSYLAISRAGRVKRSRHRWWGTKAMR